MPKAVSFRLMRKTRGVALGVGRRLVLVKSLTAIWTDLLSADHLVASTSC